MPCWSSAAYTVLRVRFDMVASLGNVARSNFEVQPFA